MYISSHIMALFWLTFLAKFLGTKFMQNLENIANLSCKIYNITVFCLLLIVRIMTDDWNRFRTKPKKKIHKRSFLANDTTQKKLNKNKKKRKLCITYDSKTSNKTRKKTKRRPSNHINDDNHLSIINSNINDIPMINDMDINKNDNTSNIHNNNNTPNINDPNINDNNDNTMNINDNNDNTMNINDNNDNTMNINDHDNVEMFNTNEYEHTHIQNILKSKFANKVGKIAPNHDIDCEHLYNYYKMLKETNSIFILDDVRNNSTNCIMSIHTKTNLNEYGKYIIVLKSNITKEIICSCSK